MADSAPVLLLDPSGTTVPVAPEEVPKYSTLGYVPASPKQVSDYQLQQKYGTPLEATKAFGEHAASALTFGASDWLERGLGISTPEAMAGREQADPFASMAGTVTGIAVPALATLGAAAPAEGAMGAAQVAAKLSAPSLIGEAGQAVARGVEGFLPEAPGLIGRMAAKAAATGAGSAIEGAAYGLGQSVHESALGDPSVTAESILANVGLGAALGGGIGAAFGAGGVAIGKAVEKAGEAIQGLRTAAPTASGVTDSFSAQVRATDDLIAKASEGFAKPSVPEEHSSAFTQAATEYSAAREALEKRFAVEGDLDAKKLTSILDPADTEARAAFDQYQQATNNLLKVVDDGAPHIPSGEFDKPGLDKLIDKTGDLIANYRRNATVQSALEGITGGAGVAGSIGLGHLIGGPIGHVVAAAGLVGKALRYVPSAVEFLSNLERNNSAIANQIRNGVASVVTGTAEVGRTEAVAGIPKIFAKPLEDAQGAYQRTIDKLAPFQNPQILHSALAQQSDALQEHAPNTSQALQIATARAYSFLASKIPPRPQLGPLQSDLPPSRQQMATFQRYVEAVNNPLGIVKQAAAGTLTPESVEAVRAVYPKLYAQIQTALLDKLATPSKSIPYSRAMMAATLLGQPVDGTMQAHSIVRNQAVFAGPQGHQAPAGGGTIRPTQGGAGKLSIAERSRTPAQAAAARGT